MQVHEIAADLIVTKQQLDGVLSSNVLLRTRFDALEIKHDGLFADHNMKCNESKGLQADLDDANRSIKALQRSKEGFTSKVDPDNNLEHRVAKLEYAMVVSNRQIGHVRAAFETSQRQLPARTQSCIDKINDKIARITSGTQLPPPITVSPATIDDIRAIQADINGRISVLEAWQNTNKATTDLLDKDLLKAQSDIAHDFNDQMVWNWRVEQVLGNRMPPAPPN